MILTVCSENLKVPCASSKEVHKVEPIFLIRSFFSRTYTHICWTHTFAGTEVAVSRVSWMVLIREADLRCPDKDVLFRPPHSYNKQFHSKKKKNGLAYSVKILILLNFFPWMYVTFYDTK